MLANAFFPLKSVSEDTTVCSVLPWLAITNIKVIMFPESMSKGGGKLIVAVPVQSFPIT